MQFFCNYRVSMSVLDMFRDRCVEDIFPNKYKYRISKGSLQQNKTVKLLSLTP